MLFIKLLNGEYYTVTNNDLVDTVYKIQKLMKIKIRTEILPINDLQEKQTRVANVYKFEIDHTVKVKHMKWYSYRNNYLIYKEWSTSINYEDILLYDHLDSDTNLIRGHHSWCNEPLDNDDAINNFKSFYIY